MPEYCCSILLSLQFLEGQVGEGARDAQLQDSSSRHCLWKVSPAKLKGAVRDWSEILHASCLADLNGRWFSQCYHNLSIIPAEGSLFCMIRSVLEENLSLLSQAYIATRRQWISVNLTMSFENKFLIAQKNITCLVWKGLIKQSLALLALLFSTLSLQKISLLEKMSWNVDDPFLFTRGTYCTYVPVNLLSK